MTRDRTASDVPRSELDQALVANERYAAAFDRSTLPAAPARKLAIVACMDARIRVEELLGLAAGDAHIIRNAGGLATDDAIRSIVISQQLLGTEEVIVIEHTKCGLLDLPEADVREELAHRTGADLDLPFHGFADLEENLRAQVERIRTHPWTKDAPVHGLIYDVETGRIRHVV